MSYESVRDRFNREVDILRGIGGHVTVGDLRHLGEAEAWESDRLYAYLDAGVSEIKEQLGFAVMRLDDALAWRHDPDERDPEIRDLATIAARQAIEEIRKLRRELAAAEALRRERAEEGL